MRNMPQQDKTGPIGEGPMTGRSLGSCGRGVGSGLDKVYGRVMYGWFRRKYQAMSKEERKDLLQAELDDLRQEAQTIEDELKELEK